jgi:hypothetical protein
MNLNKKGRAELAAKYGGRCAYCGVALGERWHADHLQPIRRESKWVRGKGFVATGQCKRPERDTMANLMPSCGPCNIDKDSLTLEQWRAKLSGAPDVLARNNPTYRHAIRFGLVVKVTTEVVFFFERQPAQATA